MRSGASDLKQGDHPDGPEAATLVLESPEDLKISNYHARMPTSADGEEARSQGRSHLVKIKVSARLRPSCRLWQRLFLVFPIFWGAGACLHPWLTGAPLSPWPAQQDRSLLHCTLDHLP